jgi:hypothetical protein
MFGNTRTVAEHIAAGLGPTMQATVVRVAEATPEMVAAADLVVVGGPTHAHSMSRKTTRHGAADVAAKQPELELEPGYEDLGVREWLQELTSDHPRSAAAFDTRIDMAPALTGRASKGVARRLRKLGFTLVDRPQSFLVDKHSHLLDGEAGRAEAWGAALADRMSSLAARPAARQS